jgi:hypothetical protein
VARKASLTDRARGKRHESASEDAVESAMREVHTNVPKNVKATGKTGAAKEAMIRAIGFSKARARTKKRGKK